MWYKQTNLSSNAYDSPTFMQVLQTSMSGQSDAPETCGAFHSAENLRLGHRIRGACITYINKNYGVPIRMRLVDSGFSVTREDIVALTLDVRSI